MMQMVLAQEAIVGLLSLGIMAAASWLYFRYWRLPVERKWLREHAIQHWIYFRNIEWRCMQKLPEALKNQEMLTAASRNHLQKLLHDLAAFQELTRMWERRTNDLGHRNRYLKGIHALSEACDELTIALRRHAMPLLEADTSTPEGRKDFQQYASYFLGESERIFGSGLTGHSASDGRLARLALVELTRQRAVTLRDRITCCEAALIGATKSVLSDFVIRAEDVWGATAITQQQTSTSTPRP